MRKALSKLGSKSATIALLSTEKFQLVQLELVLELVLESELDSELELELELDTLKP